MNSRARFLGPYMVALCGLTALMLLWAGLQVASAPYPSASHILLLGLLVVLSMLSSQWKVYSTGSTHWVMGAAAHMVLIILLPAREAILAVAVAKIGAELLQLRATIQTPWKKFAVNASGTVLAVAAGSLVFHALSVQWIWADRWNAPRALPGLAASMLAYHLINVLVVVIAITLTSREMPWSVFVRVTRGTSRSELAIMVVGVLCAALFHTSPALCPLMAVPLILSLRAFQAVARLQNETVEAVLKIAESIDFRDTGTAEHSKRLAVMSGRLAHLAGLTSEHVEDVKLAARVHDLGKIGIGNDVLLKQGRLTDDEQDAMRQHPVIGENILASYSAFKGSLEIVRHHHEHWDGTGYPDGLKGEAIPIGARIISVVDAFDAMTADRPYRQGMPVADAVERLKAGMGTQFDARLCGLFVQMLVQEGIYRPVADPRSREATVLVSGDASTGQIREKIQTDTAPRYPILGSVRQPATTPSNSPRR